MSLSKEELFEVVKAQGHSNRMITAHWTGVDNTVLFFVLMAVPNIIKC